MIGHHVEHLPHSVLAQCSAQPVEGCTVADLRIERVVIDDVVTVRTPRTGLEVRRGIDVAHAQRREIRHQLGRLREAELAIELQAIGGPRHIGAHRRGVRGWQGKLALRAQGAGDRLHGCSPLGADHCAGAHITTPMP